MLRGIFKLFATIVTMAAFTLFVAGLGAVWMASFLLTWPRIWGTPARRRISAGMDLLGAFIGFIGTFPVEVSRKQMTTMARAAVEAIPEDDHPIGD